MKQKFFFAVLIIMISLFTYSQPFSLHVSNNSCFTMTSLGNHRYQLTATNLAQCNDCYYWTITPANSSTNPNNLVIIGSNLHRNLVVEVRGRGKFHIEYVSFKNGQCHPCIIEAKSTGECGCLDECKKVCFVASPEHPNNVNDDRFDDNPNNETFLSVKTTPYENCNCIDRIEYYITGDAVIYDGMLGNHPNVNLIQTSNQHFTLTLNGHYFDTHNAFNFEIHGQLTTNIAYKAKIFFRGTTYSVFIDGYHITHPIDHDPDEGTRTDCWYPEQGVISSRPNNQTSSEQIKIYPNPTHDAFKIIFDKEDKYEILLMDQMDKIIFSTTLLGNKISLNKKDLKLNKGVYTIVIKTKNTIFKEKILIE